MVNTFSLAAAAAALLSTATAQQFVMYTPGGDDTAVERVDPILYPGVISQHVHQVFGNGAMAPNSDYDSLQDTDCTTVADASDNANADDNSVYWHPALFMQAANGSGLVRVPTNGHKLYYKDAGSDDDTKADPFEFPKGFRMLAGNPFIRKAPTDLHQQNITQWICHADSGMNQGTDGGFPTGVTDCASVDGFNGAIHFPHCWNGQDFNLLAPTAHVVYPDGDIQEGKCPDSHPTRLPHIFLENTFDIHSVVDQVKPDTFVLAQGDNTGYGWHADFLNGWVSGAIPGLLQSCPQGKYGNEDIGSCGTFKKRSVKASDCKLKTTFVENVDYPGKFLPGCNPIVDTNPAPIMQVAALGISTNLCNAVGSLTSSAGNTGGSDSDAGSSSASSAAASSTAPASSSSSTVEVASSTAATVTTSPAEASSFTTSTTQSPPAYSSASSSLTCPDDDGTQFTASNGKVFEVECGTDHVAGNLDMLYAHGLADCIAACASHSDCVDVSLSGAACYMKKSLSNAIQKNGINGAKLVSGSATTTATAPVTTTHVVATSTSVAADGDIVWITEVLTVTALPTPAIKARQEHARNHMHAHANAKFHVGRRAF